MILFRKESQNATYHLAYISDTRPIISDEHISEVLNIDNLDDAEKILTRLVKSNWLTDKNLDAVEINLENLFNEDLCSPEENAVRLKFLIDHTESVLSEIKNNNQKFNIIGYDTPYGLELYISEPNNKFFLTAYSNLDDDMLWDKMIEWVDDLGYNDKL